MYRGEVSLERSRRLRVQEAVGTNLDHMHRPKSKTLQPRWPSRPSWIPAGPAPGENWRRIDRAHMTIPVSIAGSTAV